VPIPMKDTITNSFIDNSHTFLLLILLGLGILSIILLIDRVKNRHKHKIRKGKIVFQDPKKKKKGKNGEIIEPEPNNEDYDNHVVDNEDQNKDNVMIDENNIKKIEKNANDNLHDGIILNVRSNQFKKCSVEANRHYFLFNYFIRVFQVTITKNLLVSFIVVINSGLSTAKTYEVFLAHFVIWVWVIIIPMTLFVYLRLRQNTLMSPQMMIKYGCYYLNYRGVFKDVYAFIMQIKFMALPCICVFFWQYPHVQMTSLLCLSFFNIMFVTKYMPFSKVSKVFTEAISEGVLMGYIILIFVLEYVTSLRDTAFPKYASISLMGVLLLVRTFRIVYDTIYRVKALVKFRQPELIGIDKPYIPKTEQEKEIEEELAKRGDVDDNEEKIDGYEEDRKNEENENVSQKSKSLKESEDGSGKTRDASPKEESEGDVDEFVYHINNDELSFFDNLKEEEHLEKYGYKNFKDNSHMSQKSKTPHKDELEKNAKNENDNDQTANSQRQLLDKSQSNIEKLKNNSAKRNEKFTKEKDQNSKISKSKIDKEILKQVGINQPIEENLNQQDYEKNQDEEYQDQKNISNKQSDLKSNKSKNTFKSSVIRPRNKNDNNITEERQDTNAIIETIQSKKSRVFKKSEPNDKNSLQRKEIINDHVEINISESGSKKSFTNFTNKFTNKNNLEAQESNITPTKQITMNSQMEVDELFTQKSSSQNQEILVSQAKSEKDKYILTHKSAKSGSNISYNKSKNNLPSIKEEKEQYNTNQPNAEEKVIVISEESEGSSSEESVYVTESEGSHKEGSVSYYSSSYVTVKNSDYTSVTGSNLSSNLKNFQGKDGKGGKVNIVNSRNQMNRK
jgi:hypothetical protein